jgi:hypothetical protein
MAKRKPEEPSAFEKLVKAVVSVPKDELAKLKKQDAERKRRSRTTAAATK